MHRIKYTPCELDHMPAFLEWEDVVTWFSERHKCNLADARTEADKYRKIWSANRDESPIMYLKVKCAFSGWELGQWKGRKTPPAYLKFGLVPPWVQEDDLTWVLARGIGKSYVTLEQLCEILQKEYRAREVKAKRDYIKVHLREFVKYDRTFKVYRIVGTRSPRSPSDVASLPLRRNVDLQTYGHLPESGLYHVLPGETYSRENSQLLAFLMEANPVLETLEDAEQEYHRLRRKRIWEYRRDADDHNCGRYFPLTPKKKATKQPAKVEAVQEPQPSSNGDSSSTSSEAEPEATRERTPATVPVPAPQTLLTLQMRAEITSRVGWDRKAIGQQLIARCFVWPEKVNAILDEAERAGLMPWLTQKAEAEQQRQEAEADCIRSEHIAAGHVLFCRHWLDLKNLLPEPSEEEQQAQMRAGLWGVG